MTLHCIVRTFSWTCARFSKKIQL